MGICARVSIQAQMHRRPMFPAFFPNQSKSIGLASLLCGGCDVFWEFRSAFVGVESLERQEADRSPPFPSAWPSNCRGSPNNGIPRLLDANTQDLEMVVGTKHLHST